MNPGFQMPAFEGVLHGSGVDMIPYKRVGCNFSMNKGINNYGDPENRKEEPKSVYFGGSPVLTHR